MVGADLEVLSLCLLNLAFLEQFWNALVRSLQQVAYHVELLFFWQDYYIWHFLWLFQQAIKVRGWCSSLKSLVLLLLNLWRSPITHLDALGWSHGCSSQETALVLRCDTIIDLFLLEWCVFCAFSVSITNLTAIIGLIKLFSGVSLGLFRSILVRYLVHLLLLLLDSVQTALLDNTVLLYFEKLYCVLELVWCKLQVLDGLIEQAQSLITACQIVVETHYQVRFARFLFKLTLRKRWLNEGWTNRCLDYRALDWTDQIISGGFASWVAWRSLGRRLKNFLAGRSSSHSFYAFVNHRDSLYGYLVVNHGAACPFQFIRTNIPILIESAYYSLLLSLLFFNFRVSRHSSGRLLVNYHRLLNCCRFLCQLDCASLNRLLWRRQPAANVATFHYGCFLL